MRGKYCCVIDAGGFYKDLVLAFDVPVPEKLVLDLGEIGSAEMSPARWEAVSTALPEIELAQLDACKAVPSCPHLGKTEDGQVLCYAPSMDGETAALFIVDPEHESVFRLVGPLTREGDKLILKNEDSDAFIRLTFERQDGGMVEEIQNYTLAEGDSLVLRTDECIQPTIKVYAGAPGYIRPKWDGTVWTEGATDEEIAAWKLEHPAPPPPPPSPVDVLGTQVAQLTLDNMQLNQFINVMGPELAQTKLELMSLKTAEGGVTDGVLETGL